MYDEIMDNCLKNLYMYIKFHFPFHILAGHHFNIVLVIEKNQNQFEITGNHLLSFFFQEYYVSGAEFKISNPKFHLYHKYELKFGESTVIKPVKGDLSPCVRTFPSTAKPAGSQAESSDNGKSQFRPIPLKAVRENMKSGSFFGNF